MNGKTIVAGDAFGGRKRAASSQQRAAMAKPGTAMDGLARRTSAKQRRLGHFWLTLAWIGPGAVVSWVFRDSVPWVAFMSWYAIVVTHLAGWSAETPAEVEEEPPTEG